MNVIGNMHYSSLENMCLTHWADVCHRGQTYGQWAEHLFLSFTHVCLDLIILLGFIRLRITISCICYNRISLVRGFAWVREVSIHLHPFYVKRGICQLTDHAYDMSMFIFCNYLVTVLLNKLLKCIVWHDIPVCAVVMVMGLLYRLYIMVKRVYYIGLWIHWFRDHDATIPNGTVTTRRTSVGVGHSGSDPIMPLMLRTVCFVQWLEHWHCTTDPSR